MGAGGGTDHAGWGLVVGQIMLDGASGGTDHAGLGLVVGRIMLDGG